ncbi:MAG: tRNA-dihydrouridine synthase family protein [Chthoniobacterales bacterium]
MSSREDLDMLLASPAPVLALAPMQDVTDLPFWRLMTRYGGADLYYTEYFRVYPTSRLDKAILESITKNPTGRPAIAQMIGNDIPSLVRSASELQNHPIAAIDLNLGCPAPVVYRKCAGGGLLRDLPRIDGILGSLREAIPGKFTVKTRLGFDAERTIESLLPLFAKHAVDLVTVHGRTVLQMYRGGIRHDLIRLAVESLDCPVLANGNVSTPGDAESALRATSAKGLMIGRGAVRNPWIFSQIRDHLAGKPVRFPTGREVLAYIHDLYESVCDPTIPEPKGVQKIKKYANFLGEGISPEFLHAVRRAGSKEEFFALCREHLDHDRPMQLDPKIIRKSGNQEKEGCGTPSLRR